MLSAQQSSNRNQSYEQKIETHFEVVYQEMEASYNRINDSIDQIFAPSDFNHALTPFIIKSHIFSTLKIPSISFDFSNQLTHQINPLIQTIVSKQANNKQQQVQNILQSIPQQNLNPITYQLIQPNSIKQNEWCYAVAINKDNSIVVAGCDKIIKVYKLKQERLNQIQSLQEHSNCVLTLDFMKKSNNFVSGSRDDSIIIWQLNQNDQWTCQQKLNQNSYSIYCLLLNNNEDLIISGSANNSIKFWDKQKGWLCQQTIKDHTSWVYSLSLNEQEDKLISCSRDSQILVFEQSQKDKMWTRIQAIKVNQNGYRLCFIDNNQFTFQPRATEQMDVYEMSGADKQFVKTKQIAVQCGFGDCSFLFPQKYLKSRCLLVNKNGFHVNLIRKKQTGEFIIEQTIKFKHNYIYGSLSDDGEFLIMWDFNSKEIQIRKCYEK